MRHAEGDPLKKLLGVLAKILLSILCVVVLAGLFLVGRWLVRREDPTAFIPDTYTAYLQVPSIRGIYDTWLNLEAVDLVLSRPDLAAYRRVVADVRGLALTKSPLLRTLLDVHADVILLKDGKLLMVLDLGWRGIASPLARIVGPVLNVRGFSFLNDSGTPLYRYTTGGTTIHAAFAENVAILSLDASVVKEALERRATGTGLAMRASRDLLDRIRLRRSDAVRILVDTASLSTRLLAGSSTGDRVLGAVKIPGQSMLDVTLSDTSLRLGAQLPLDVAMPELGKTLATAPAPLGVLRFVPDSAYLLTASSLAPLRGLYQLAADFQGKDVQDIFTRADAGARSVLGMGIDQLLFSWVGAELGAFMLPTSADPVFFARISSQESFQRALTALAGSAVAGKDSSLVIDGSRIDRLTIPWYVGLVLDVLGVNVPEPYFVTRGDYLFASLDATNLSAVLKAADTGSNIAAGNLYASLSRGIPSDPTFMVWYDITRTEPFFIKGAGIFADILRLYTSGIAAVRATPTELQVSLSAARVVGGGARLAAGFPLAPEKGVGQDLLAFRFADSRAARLSWVKAKSLLVLADAGGTPIAQAQLDPDTRLVPEQNADGALAALWAVSPSGTIWRFGPALIPQAPFPVASGIVSTMPPIVIGGSLALFSRNDAAIVLIGADGARRLLAQHLDAPLLAAPDVVGARMAFYPKSFDAHVHLTDLDGTEEPGWPVAASGISFCSPRIVATGDSVDVFFLTQAGVLHGWDATGMPLPAFPLNLPGVYYANPEILSAGGRPVLAILAQDGTLSLVGMDGSILRQVRAPDVDGKTARIFIGDVNHDGGNEILLYGSGAFIAGYDAALRPLPGYPLKGVTRPQLVDLDQDGTPELVTAGIDGKIYAYAMTRMQQ